MNYNNDYYENKYKDFLKYFCYNCVNNNDSDDSDDNIDVCYKLSPNMNNRCELCESEDNINNPLEQYRLKKNNIVSKIKLLLSKCEKAQGRENKIIHCLDVYKIIYFNMFMPITYPKLLITNINKINELINLNYDDINKFVENNKSYDYVFNFMKNIYNYMKTNNIDTNKILDTQESYDIFFDTFLKFLEKYYSDEIVSSQKNNDNDNNNNIDINNISLISICLDI